MEFTSTSRTLSCELEVCMLLCSCDSITITDRTGWYTVSHVLGYSRPSTSNSQSFRDWELCRTAMFGEVYVTVYEIMGHAANLFKMPFYVLFDSAFLLYILIFFPFLYEKALLCNDPTYTMPGECKHLRNAAWNIFPYTCSVYGW